MICWIFTALYILYDLLNMYCSNNRLCLFILDISDMIVERDSFLMGPFEMKVLDFNINIEKIFHTAR